MRHAKDDSARGAVGHLVEDLRLGSGGLVRMTCSEGVGTGLESVEVLLGGAGVGKR